MAVCRRCGIEIGFISWLFTSNWQKGRCKNCDTAVQQALIRFREAFLQLSDDVMFTQKKFQYLAQKAANDRIDLDEALAFIREDALYLLDRILDAIIDQGSLTDQAESYIYQVQRMLAISDTEASSILRQISFLNIYRGKLPIVSQKRIQDIRLGSDETCYLLTSAQYHKVDKTSTQIISGRLVVTNRRLLFLSEAGGSEMLWNSVMSIKRQVRNIRRKVEGAETEILVPVYGIYLELNKKDGHGFYSVPDSEMVEAIINTLVRIAKGQMVRIDTGNSHHIPLQLPQQLGNLESEPEKGRKHSPRASP